MLKTKTTLVYRLCALSSGAYSGGTCGGNASSIVWGTTVRMSNIGEMLQRNVAEKCCSNVSDSWAGLNFMLLNGKAPYKLQATASRPHIHTQPFYTYKQHKHTFWHETQNFRHINYKAKN